LLEMRLVKNLKEFLGDRTLIVATHRAPVLQLVDRIIWLDSGRIVADGPKADVLKRMSGAAAA
jgi:ATP-binding cassette subfamily C protein LapB